ncbi:T9SS type A sorting domain-containing protein [Lutibacter sp.]|uniref:T9SS type A sorting domain-containing protein n=1 Tax=Lutibacter sp. TaxID=1925666 RepID=UPI003567D5F8
MKKLLIILLLFCSSFGFAQQTTNNAALNKNQNIETISVLSASPNPLSIKTQISFVSNKGQLIEFSVKNLLGKTVYNERIEVSVGNNSIQFNRNNLPQGMYIYSLQTDTEIISKRLVIK